MRTIKKENMEDNKLLEIHKLANEISNSEYREHTISMYDVGVVVRAIEELTRRMYRKGKK